MTVATEARRLHAAGISPVPIRVASKSAFSGWKRLTVTRLHETMLDQVFANADKAVGIAAIVGRISNNLFVVDCDTLEAAQWMENELVRREMRTWKRSSARGAQFWFRCKDGEVENQPLCSAGYEILGHDRIAVAPPSIHPDSGEILEWLDLPELLKVTTSDMAWLGLRLHSAGKRSREKRCALPPVADQVLLGQDTSGYNGDNSRAEWAATWSLLGAGYSDEEITAIFSRCAPPHFKKIGITEWKRACLVPARAAFEAQKSDGQNSVLARKALQIRAFVESMVWKGATGNTDRAVLIALTERMRLDNAETFRGSQREIAVLAGISSMTSGKAIKRLVAGSDPWIVFTGSTNISGASCWRFHESVLQRIEDTSESSTVARKGYTPIQSNVLSLDSLDADTWHQKALGKSAQAVLTQLSLRADGATVKALALATGKALNTVKAALAKLESHGIVHKDSENWCVSSDADLTTVAWDSGTAGRTEAKKALYQREREIQTTRLTLDSMLRNEK